MIKLVSVLVGLFVVCAIPAPVLAGTLGFNITDSLSCHEPTTIPGVEVMGDISFNTPDFGLHLFDHLVGSCLNVGSITGLNTSHNANVTLQCSACLLNFDAGDFSHFQPPHPPSPGLNDVVFFSGGGSIDVRGAIPSLGILPGTTLLSGTFLTQPQSQMRVVNALAREITASFEDRKDAGLLAFYGVADGIATYPGTLDIGFDNNEVRFTTFEVDNVGGELVNVVPEPPTALLFVSSILSCLTALILR